MQVERLIQWNPGGPSTFNNGQLMANLASSLHSHLYYFETNPKHHTISLINMSVYISEIYRPWKNNHSTINPPKMNNSLISPKMQLVFKVPNSFIIFIFLHFACLNKDANKTYTLHLVCLLNFF